MTVPILVYVVGVEAHAAISLGLILVGSTALVGAFLHQEAAPVAWKQGLLFVCFGAPLNILSADFPGTFPAQFYCCYLGC